MRRKFSWARMKLLKELEMKENYREGPSHILPAGDVAVYSGTICGWNAESHGALWF